MFMSIRTGNLIKTIVTRYTRVYIYIVTQRNCLKKCHYKFCIRDLLRERLLPI